MIMIRTAHPPLKVTSLPPDPYDGQEVFLDLGDTPEIGHYRWDEALNRWQQVGEPAISCRVYRDNTQPISGLGLPSYVVFNAARWDAANMHSPNVNPSRITIPQKGLYLVTSQVQIAGSGGNTRSVFHRFNGDTIISYVKMPPSGSSTSLSVTTAWMFNQGDYVETGVAQDSGSNQNVAATPAQSPEMTVTRISGGGA